MNFKTRLGTWTIFLLILVSGLYLFQDNTVMADTNTTINSTLEIWHTDLVYVNETFTIYANYSYENGSIPGFEICHYNNKSMDFNMSSGLYYYQDIYETAGNYSYTINCYEEGYENLTELSEIEILPLETNDTVDNDNDTYDENEDCDDNNPDVNPGQKEILYNNIDDDCNPNTLDYLIFDIITDQLTYNPGGTVDITIDAHNGSDTYLTINTPTNVSYVYIFSNGSYPVTQQFSLTTLSGLYSIEGINYYENYTNTDTAEFSIDNTFNINIQVDEDNVYENEEIHFEAVITGAVGNVNLIWNMDDGTEIYDTEFDYNYDNSGIYNVVLIATDEGQNQIIKTKQIQVNKKYLFKVKVLDNKSKDLIEGAAVKLDSDKETTNESGLVEYIVTNRTYGLRVSADEYYTYEQDVKINKSTTFNVELDRRAEQTPPLITLLSPANNTEINKGEFKFKFADNSNASCTLYISDGSGWWVDYNTSTGLQPSTEYSFKVNLDYGEYYWKITCTDIDDNQAYSPEYFVTINSGNVALTSNEADTTYNVIQEVYDVIPDFDTYSPDEKKIVEYLKMDVLIKDAKRKLDMANRDLFNLKYQPDSVSLINRREEIYAGIDNIKDTTPLSVSAKDKVEFVKYVDDTELQKLFEDYLKLKNLDLSKKDKKKLSALNKELQKKTTIATKAYVVEIKYISGRTEEVTLIARTIDFGVTKNLMYVEFIPKELVESSDNIVFVTKPDKVLNKDPVFEISADKVTEVVYYINDKLSLDKIPKIKPVVLTTVLEDSGDSISGFVIFDKLGFSESNKTVFIIELLVVFVLLGVFFYYRSARHVEIKPLNVEIKPLKKEHPSRKNRVLKEPGDPHKISYLRKVINQTNQLLKNNDLKKAALKYYEAKFLYDLLEEHDKKTIFDDIIDLSDQITYRHIQGLIDNAIIALAQNNYDTAYELYEEIQSEFDKLSEEHQGKIYPKCCELALHLNSIKNE